MISHNRVQETRDFRSLQGYLLSIKPGLGFRVLGCYGFLM